MLPNEEKSFERLRQIFLSESEKKQEEFENELKNLKFQITDKNSKINANYPIITDLLKRKIDEAEEEVTNVLSPIIGKGLKKEIIESKDEIIDSLYPIIGQTIKKYVSESIKDVYQSINLKIDSALRKGIFSKQIKSKISGVSAADLILQQSFPFIVNEVFLIHEESGILISHVSSDDKNSSDADLISGMLTAIKNFVSESFKDENGDQNLYEIQYGDSRIILERGRHTYLAIVVKGSEPVSFDEKLIELNSIIHAKYSKYLRSFNGEFNNLSGIDLPIKKFIENYKAPKNIINEEKYTEKPKPILLYLLGIIFIVIIIFWSIFNIPSLLSKNKINNEIESRLSALTEINTNSINWENQKEIIKLNGFVNSFDSKQKIYKTLISIAGVDSIENNLNILIQNLPPETILNSIQTKINNTRFGDYDKLSFQVDNDKVIISGLVDSYSDKREIGFLVSQIDGIRLIQNDLNYNYKNDFDESDIEKYLNSLKIQFDYGKTVISKEHIEKLNSIIPFIKTNRKFLQINSFLDNIGNNETNLNYALKRAESVKNYLLSQGVDGDKIEIFTINSDQEGNNRSVMFKTRNL